MKIGKWNAADAFKKTIEVMLEKAPMSMWEEYAKEAETALRYKTTLPNGVKPEHVKLELMENFDIPGIFINELLDPSCMNETLQTLKEKGFY